MANETNNDFAGALTNLFSAGSAFLQQGVELLTSGLKTTTQIIEPLGKSAIDLIGSATNTLGQVIQSVSSAVAPKK